AYRLVRQGLRSERYAALVLHLLAWIESRGWRRQDLADGSLALLSPLRPVACELLGKRARKARKPARRFAELDGEARHDFRIALKKLRSAAACLYGLYRPAVGRRYVKCVARLQDKLGLLNDLRTAEAMVEELAGSEAASPDVQHGAAVASGWLRS